MYVRVYIINLCFRQDTVEYRRLQTYSASITEVHCVTVLHVLVHVYPVQNVTRSTTSRTCQRMSEAMSIPPPDNVKDDNLRTDTASRTTYPSISCRDSIQKSFNN